MKIMQKTPFRDAKPVSLRKAMILSLLFGGLLLFPLASQAGFWDSALKFGKNVLATAAGNYTSNYEQDLGQLLQALRQPVAGNQPLLQGSTQGNLPENPYNSNTPTDQNPYGQNAPYGSNPNDGNPYGQDQAYSQGNQQGEYDGQAQGTGYPADPNYGTAPLGNTYPQDQGYDDPNNPYGSNPQNEGYEQNSGAYSQNPQYGDPSQGQGYNDPYNSQQGYPTQPNAGQYPSDNTNPYAQTEGGNPPYPSNPGNPGYPSQQGNNDPYQAAAPQQPFDPQYGQPQFQQSAQPPYPTEPFTPQPNYSNPTLEQSIQLDVAIVKKTEMNGAETMRPINDGDVLKDGRGNAQAGDKFRIMFRANTECYVYVIAIDGSAWAQGIFPNLTNPFANPVKPGQQYILPGNTNWLSLDQFKGIETLFFVASPEKRQDIEDILANIAGKERHPKASPQQVTEAPIIPAGYYRSQTGSSPFIIGQESAITQGQGHNLIPTTYFTQKAGEALRVTRWFRHE